MDNTAWKLPGTADPSLSEREKQHAVLARRAAAEGIVLLENDGVLPLAAGSAVALYGYGARYTVKGGTGSGSVNNRYNVTVDQGLRNAGFRVTTDAWLDDYDARCAAAHETWVKKVYALAGEPGSFEGLYHAYSGNPMQAPAGADIAKTDTDTAIYVISRISGEGADRKAAPGDYYLSDIEQRDLEAVCAAYQKVIVILNVGGVMDLSFLDKLPVSALVLLSQAGMEGGNALADVLSGKAPVSGRLTDSWARDYADYPSSAHFSHNDGNLIREYYNDDIYVGYRYFDSFGVSPRYPFGYGLSYTSFTRESGAPAVANGKVCLPVTVRNTGSRPGRETVLLFAACPAGLRQKERKRLIAFGKTKELAPGETETLMLETCLSHLASYHTGKASWYLDAGRYTLLLGADSEHTAPIAVLTLAETAFLHRTGNICPLHDALKTIQPEAARQAAWEAADKAAAEGLPVLPLDGELSAIAAAFVPEKAEEDPADAWAKEMVKKLTRKEKAALACGRIRQGDPSFIGNAAVKLPGAAGETTAILLDKYGIDSMILCDGPAGLRIQQKLEFNPADGSLYTLSRYEMLENRFFGKLFPHDDAIVRWQFASAIPVGTLLAQTFDLTLMEEVGALIGREMEEFGVTLWLAPGMNIHRNPLCGRNFEYYSEDPLLSGKMAAALTRGVQRCPGCGTTIKHYACNNQEENRRGVSSVVSERALREIYLRGFEIAVRESQPASIMTSYNKINGEHTANSHDLCTATAREQWGFRGVIMTDWTTTNREGGSSAAKCVSAGNDLTMPGLMNDILEILDALDSKGDQSLDEKDLDACAVRILATAKRMGCVKG